MKEVNGGRAQLSVWDKDMGSADDSLGAIHVPVRCLGGMRACAQKLQLRCPATGEHKSGPEGALSSISGVSTMGLGVQSPFHTLSAISAACCLYLGGCVQ